jgi:hypothetical protein
MNDGMGWDPAEDAFFFCFVCARSGFGLVRLGAGSIWVSPGGGGVDLGWFDVILASL